MKSFPIATVFVLLHLSASFLAAEGGTRLTREELLARRAATQERAVQLKPVEPLADQSHPSQASILDTSVILTSGRNWTFVPKGAVLVQPEAYQDRVDREPRGEFLHFKDFLAKNRGWLTTLNISLAQARGQEPVKEGARKALIESGRVVVTTCKGGPVASRKYVEANSTAKN